MQCAAQGLAATEIAAIPDTPDTVTLLDPGMSVAIRCESCTSIAFSGSLAASGTGEVEVTLQYYNVLAPLVLANIDYGAKITVVAGVHIPFSLTGNVTLGPGTYVFNVVATNTNSSDAGAVTVQGNLSVQATRKA